MVQLIFWIIVSILVFDFILEQSLNWLNSSNRKKPLPRELEGVYDEATLLKQQNYQRENERLSLFSASLMFVISFAVIVWGGFAWFDNFARSFAINPIIISLIFFGVIFIISDIISIPFEIYATFGIEQKYEFNKTTPALWLADKLKGYLLIIIIGGGLMWLFLWYYHKTGSNFWIYMWAVYTAFVLFMTLFYSNIIVPLFNKQTPLPDGELRDAILEFGQKSGFKIDNIYVIDGSKRSTKANAYFTGLGPKKRIVLYDTLIEQLSVHEIVAVLAHEIGHYKKKHTLQGLVLSTLQMGLTLYILSLFIAIPEFSLALGVSKPAIHIGLIAFGILYSPISTILGLGFNVLSRKNEYEADAYAASFNLSVALISGLKKLSVNNLSNINPHKAYVFFHYSHPTLLQRIVALNK